MIALALACLQDADVVDRWIERLREARTVRIVARAGIAADLDAPNLPSEVRVWYAAPDRLRVELESGGASAWLAVEGPRAVAFRYGQYQACPPPPEDALPNGVGLLLPAIAHGWTQLATPGRFHTDASVDEPGGRRVSGRIRAGGATAVMEARFDAMSGFPTRQLVRMAQPGDSWALAFDEVRIDEPDEEPFPEVPEDLGLPPLIAGHAWLPEVPRVSLRLRDTPLLLACAELLEQTGFAFSVPSDLAAERVRELEAVDVPFWQALALLDQAVEGADVQPEWASVTTPSEFRIPDPHFRWSRRRPDGSNTEGLQAVAAGPVLVTIESISWGRGRSFATQPGEASMYVVLSYGPMPSVQALGFHAWRVFAETEAEVLESPDLAATRAFEMQPQAIQGIRLPFPRVRTTRLRRLCGTLAVGVARVAEEFRLEPSDEPFEWSRDGVALRVEPFQAAEGHVRVEARLTWEGEHEPRRGPIRLGGPLSVRVFDSEGRPINRGGGGGGGEPWTCFVEGRLPEGRTFGWALVRVRAGVRRVDLPFEFRDVGLEE